MRDDQPTRTAETRHEALFVAGYRIIRTLGQGGMGIVYEAEQLHPRRPVALKVVRGGALAGDHERRLFEREAQALARLRHPSIAAIYEAGWTADGQPFFTMELARGERLDTHLRRQAQAGPLSRAHVRTRLQIFRQACDAIHYAHQRGVIHRDLKPANLLVLADAPATSADHLESAPSIKLLDFGLARITDAELGGSVVTEAGLVQGSLPYMSPEQIRGNPDEIDVRTDVYSLGALLYETLAGNPPFDIAGKPLHEATRVVCDEAPPRLVGTSKHVDAELQTIVFKALEKDPARRYQSVAALADDVARYMSGEPILARPPSTAYQLRKLVARHRGGFAFATTVVLLVVAFGVVAAIQARRTALAAERARKEAATAQAVSDFLVGLFQVSDPGEARGKTVTAREILDRGAMKVDRELRDQPQVRERMLRTIARVYMNLGLLSQADPLLAAALGGDTGPVDLDRADTLHTLGELRFAQGRPDDSIVLFNRALTARTAALGPDDPAVATSLNDLGVVLFAQGKYDETEPLWNRALAIRERALGPYARLTGETIQNLAVLDNQRGRWKLAEERYRRGIGIYEATLGADSPALADALNNFADLQADQGHRDESLALHQRVLTIQEKALGPDHPDLLHTLFVMGADYWMLSRTDESEAVMRRALELAGKTGGPESGRVAIALRGLARVSEDRGQYHDAAAKLEAAVRIQEKTSAATDPDFALTLNELGWALEQIKRYADAVSAHERAYAIRIKVYGAASHFVADSLDHLGRLALLQKDDVKAEKLLKQALHICENSATASRYRLLSVLGDLANLAKERGELREAEALYRRALAVPAEATTTFKRQIAKVRADYDAFVRTTANRK